MSLIMKRSTLLLVATVTAEVAEPSFTKPDFLKPRDAKPERRLIGKGIDESHRLPRFTEICFTWLIQYTIWT